MYSLSAQVHKKISRMKCVCVCACVWLPTSSLLVVMGSIGCPILEIRDKISLLWVEPPSSVDWVKCSSMEWVRSLTELWSSERELSDLRCACGGVHVRCACGGVHVKVCMWRCACGGVHVEV